MKILLAFALVAIVNADVSHLFEHGENLQEDGYHYKEPALIFEASQTHTIVDIPVVKALKPKAATPVQYVAPTPAIEPTSIKPATVVQSVPAAAPSYNAPRAGELDENGYHYDLPKQTFYPTPKPKFLNEYLPPKSKPASDATSTPAPTVQPEPVREYLPPAPKIIPVPKPVKPVANKPQPVPVKPAPKPQQKPTPQPKGATKPALQPAAPREYLPPQTRNPESTFQSTPLPQPLKEYLPPLQQMQPKPAPSSIPKLQPKPLPPKIENLPQQKPNLKEDGYHYANNPTPSFHF